MGSKVAYVKKIEETNQLLGKEEDTHFAIVMVDVNNLKVINDNYGHTYGDEYLRGCCHVICNVYKRSPVYRIGGDEFVVFVAGEDYEVRHEKLSALKKSYETTCHDTKLKPWKRYSAAMGMAEYATDDNTVELVFKRADKAMYINKQEFKKGELVNAI
ncbi:MAG: GGDEF domain-containing protein [Lachnospiraceae bacterium]|nr:GGDEF domain-containing protein [Lachnospiraceae bacterium]